MAGIVILDEQGYRITLDKLQEMGARKRDITAIFRKAASPLVRVTKRKTNVSKRGVYSRTYESRSHPPGTLRRSVKFVTSKKFRAVYYVLYDQSRKQQYDTFYQTFYVFGTRRSKGHPAPDQAFLATKEQVESKITQGVFDLQNKLWTGAK